MTLKQFVKQAGSQEAAAHLVGVSFVTINRWTHDETCISPLGQRRLSALGVVLRR